jgi:hypothetical protein
LDGLPSFTVRSPGLMLALTALLAQIAVPSGDYFIQDPSSRVCMRLSISSKISRTKTGVVERTREPTSTCGPDADDAAAAVDAGSWTNMGQFRCERKLDEDWLELEFGNGDTYDGCARPHTTTVIVALVSSESGVLQRLATAALETLRPPRDCHSELLLTVGSAQIDDGVFYSHDTDSRICTRLSVQTEEDERWNSFGSELVRTLEPPRGACDESAFAVRSAYVIATNADETAAAILEAHAIEGDEVPFLADIGPFPGCPAGATIALKVTERDGVNGDDGAPSVNWTQPFTASDCYAEVELLVSSTYAAPGGSSNALALSQECDALEANRVLDPLWQEYAGAIRSYDDDAYMDWEYELEQLQSNPGGDDVTISSRAVRDAPGLPRSVWALLQQCGHLLERTTRSLPGRHALADLASELLPSGATPLSWVFIVIGPLAAALAVTHARAREARAQAVAAAAASAAVKKLMV